MSGFPCFYQCGDEAAVEKQGKSVCRGCAARLKGSEYPLREATREPLCRYPSELVNQLGMRERGVGLPRANESVEAMR